jgi:four helix bundle protein
MAFIVADLSIELIEKLRPLVPRIRARDKSLADQIQRAASSVALNIGEGAYSDPGNRRARLHTAAGSAGETLAALRKAVAWGIIARADGAPATALLEQILAILWKLTRG